MSGTQNIVIYLVTDNKKGAQAYNRLYDFTKFIEQTLERSYSLNIDVRTLSGSDVPQWKQNEERKEICNSDVVFFLIYIDMEEYIRLGFEAVYEKLKKDGKPAIYTYFYEVDDSERSDSVKSFMKRLGGDVGHYYSFFSHIDTIKLKILMQLKLNELESADMGFRNGKLIIDKREIMDLENVKMVADNDQLAYWKKEAEKTDKEYFTLKPLYIKNPEDKELCRRYSNLAAKRENLMKTIEDTEKILFINSLNMVKTTAYGDITIRQREAYRHFEEGDSEGANEILDAEEMKKDYRYHRRKKIEEVKILTRRYIGELSTKIEILKTMLNYKGRFEDIEAAYDEITDCAFEDDVKYDKVREYASYLHEQGNSSKAIELCKRLEQIYDGNEEISQEDKANFRNTYAIILNSISGKHIEAKEHYLRALKIREELAAENPQRHKAKLASSLNNIGLFYDAQEEAKKAEKYYLRALEIREALATENPQRYKADLAVSLNGTGVFYHEQGKVKKAEKHYLRALKTREELAAENPQRYKADLAVSLNNIGVFYKDQGKVKKAEEHHLRALKIREELAAENPQRYKAELAASLNNIGNFYKDQGKVKKAEEHYLRALEIREELASENPQRYKADLAVSLNNLGIFYHNQGEAKKAEEHYLRALEIREELASENPQRYKADLAVSLNNIGNFYKDQGEAKKAEEHYLRALEIREELASENPQRYKVDLAGSLNNLGIFYKDQGKVKKAEEHHLRALKIREELASESPQRYKADLAASLNNIGNFYKDQGEAKKAEEHYLRALEIREELASENSQRYNADLADCLNNIGVFYNEQGEAKKAEEHYLGALKLYKELAAENPQRYNAYLANSLYNIGIFYYKQGEIKK